MKLINSPIHSYNYSLHRNEISFSHFCNLKDLTCLRIEITDEFLKKLPTTLEKLTLSSIDVNIEDVIGDFRHLINLKKLDLCGIKPIIDNLQIYFLKLSDVTVDKDFMNKLPISIISLAIVHSFYDGRGDTILNLCHLVDLIEFSAANSSMPNLETIMVSNDAINLMS